MNPIIFTEFILQRAPFNECHAPTIVETTEGLAVAFFAGSREGGADVGIWFATRELHGWSSPRLVATGQGRLRRYPCWNPVLFQPHQGPLLLFYKVGPSPSKWWGMLTTSDDSGQQWSKPVRLPRGILGPIKNKPLQLDDGLVLCPSSSERRGWQVLVESTQDLGQTWQSSGPLNNGRKLAAIQPSILQYRTGALQLLCRSKAGYIVSCWSSDHGQHWSSMELTVLPNPNSGTDAISLKDGRALLVYNHIGKASGKWGGRRSPLNVAISNNGALWQAGLILESQSGEYSYPAVIQATNGKVHIVYTWRRQNIRHVVIDPGRLVGVEMPGGKWPSRSPSLDAEDGALNHTLWL